MIFFKMIFFIVILSFTGCLSGTQIVKSQACTSWAIAEVWEAYRSEYISIEQRIEAWKNVQKDMSGNTNIFEMFEEMQKRGLISNSAWIGISTIDKAPVIAIRDGHAVAITSVDEEWVTIVDYRCNPCRVRRVLWNNAPILKIYSGN